MRRLALLSLFVLPYGVAFGVAAVEAGFTPLQSIGMSAMTFSGAAQFAVLEFWPHPVAFGSLALVALAVSARLIVMGAALSPWINQLPAPSRFGAIVLMSDANFADTETAFRRGERDLGVLLGGGLIFWITWVLGTAAGAAGGSLIGDPARFGIDVVMACFFGAVVVGMIEAEPDWRVTIPPVLAAGVASILLLGWLPVGWNVIVAALVGAAVGAFGDE